MTDNGLAAEFHASGSNSISGERTGAYIGRTGNNPKATDGVLIMHSADGDNTVSGSNPQKGVGIYFNAGRLELKAEKGSNTISGGQKGIDFTNGTADFSAQRNTFSGSSYAWRQSTGTAAVTASGETGNVFTGGGASSTSDAVYVASGTLTLKAESGGNVLGQNDAFDRGLETTGSQITLSAKKNEFAGRRNAVFASARSTLNAEGEENVFKSSKSKGAALSVSGSTAVISATGKGNTVIAKGNGIYAHRWMPTGSSVSPVDTKVTLKAENGINSIEGGNIGLSVNGSGSSVNLTAAENEVTGSGSTGILAKDNGTATLTAATNRIAGKSFGIYADTVGTVTVTQDGTGGEGNAVEAEYAVCASGAGSVALTGTATLSGTSGAIWSSGKDSGGSASSVTVSYGAGSRSVGNIYAADGGSVTVAPMQEGGGIAIAGDILTSGTGSSSSVTLSRGSSLTGLASTDSGSSSTVRMKEDAVWNMTGDSTLTSLALEGGTVDLAYGADESAYRTLTAQTLTGSGGLLRMRAVVTEGSEAADRLVVTGTASGSHRLLVSGTGEEPAVESMTPYLVQAQNFEQNGSDATFALAGAGVVDIGNYVYELAERDSTTDAGAKEWYLRRHVSQPDNPETPDEPLSPSAETVLAFNGANTMAAFHWSGLDDLRKRLGEVRAPRATGAAPGQAPAAASRARRTSRVFPPASKASGLTSAPTRK